MTYITFTFIELWILVGFQLLGIQSFVLTPMSLWSAVWGEALLYMVTNIRQQSLMRFSTIHFPSVSLLFNQSIDIKFFFNCLKFRCHWTESNFWVLQVVHHVNVIIVITCDSGICLQWHHWLNLMAGDHVGPSVSPVINGGRGVLG